MDKIELFPYQKEIGDMYEYPGLFMAAGTGKTFTALRRWDYLNKFSETPHKLLVVGLAAKKEEWASDIVQYWESFHESKVEPFVATGQAGDRRIVKYPNTNIVVTNFESVIRMPALINWVDEDTVIIVDESQKIKKPTAKATKMMLKLSAKVGSYNALALTGTPVSNGRYEQYYTQMKFIKEPHIGKMAKKTFDNRFTKQQRRDYGAGFPVYEIVGYKNTDTLEKWVGDRAVFLKRKSSYGMPAQEVIEFDKPKDSLYSKMAHDRVLYEDDPTKETLVYDTIGSLYMGLRQAATGITKSEVFDAERLDYTRDIVTSLEGERLVIFYSFKAELRALKGLLEALGRPYSEFNGSVKDLSTFESKDDGVALVNYMSGSTGINSLKIAHYALFFSPPMTSEVFEQSKARLDRAGVTIAPYFYVMYKKGTVEEATWKAVQAGEEFSEESFKRYIREQGIEL